VALFRLGRPKTKTTGGKEAAGVIGECLVVAGSVRVVRWP